MTPPGELLNSLRWTSWRYSPVSERRFPTVVRLSAP